MNRTRRLCPARRMACIVAGLAAALLAAATAAPAAFATRVPPFGTPPGPAPAPHQAHVIVVGSGMPGWQIALIAVAAAVVAAAIAVLLDRARAAGASRRTPRRAQPHAR
jgi:hypothetical protein